jgi:hypothetical protein
LKELDIEKHTSLFCFSVSGKLKKVFITLAPGGQVHGGSWTGLNVGGQVPVVIKLVFFAHDRPEK